MSREVRGGSPRELKAEGLIFVPTIDLQSIKELPLGIQRKNGDYVHENLLDQSGGGLSSLLSWAGWEAAGSGPAFGEAAGEQGEGCPGRAGAARWWDHSHHCHQPRGLVEDWQGHLQGA